MSVEFSRSFQALTGHVPLSWQRRLFDRLRKGTVPSACNLPTGLGKTSVIPIWLIALIADRSLPRRLVYVVNRRTVVDQATTTVERLRDRLIKADGAAMARLREGLGELSTGINDIPLAISTLRGQFADNGEWRNDPTRPAVIVGTVDMVGSRLLFGGYGCGFKSGPLHAGFLGQDTLLVHDESHLEPAFQTLITAIEAEQRRCGDSKPLRVMAMSATSVADDKDGFQLTAADQDDLIVQKRTRAKKWLALHSVTDANIVDRIADLALKYKDSGQAILVFVRELKTVEQIVKKLPKGTVKQLTGTLRGLERDSLVSTPIFQRFLPRSIREIDCPSVDGTVYLVCTSAGEVGIDISADHLVCDLAPFDSMAQRLGRINRFGDGDARVDVVHPREFDQESEYELRRERTLTLLKRLKKRKDGRIDVCPRNLERLPKIERLKAFTPPPTIVRSSEILFDAWALTTVHEVLPGRPPVADWLHGVADWEPPQTHVAWREEVELVRDGFLELYEPAALLEDYPLKPHELLRDRSDRVFKQLSILEKTNNVAPVWVLGWDGDVRPTTLENLVVEGEGALRDTTILLAPVAGGLEFDNDGRATGTLDGSAVFDESRRDEYDVADRWMDEHRQPRRCRVWDEPPPKGMRLVREIDCKDAEEVVDLNGKESGRRFWRWCVRPRSADDDGSKSAQIEQELDYHLMAAESYANRIVEKLGLPEAEAGSVVLAAKWHDLGKRRAVWQKSIGNFKYPAKVLAKSGRNRRLIELNKYRHEFGSLLNALDQMKTPGFVDLGEDTKDLLLHLIAAHHGRGRPHFSRDESFDPENDDACALAVAQEVPRRFARLQRKYGRWGLAYLESLVRAADYLASQSVDTEFAPLVEAVAR